MTWTKQNAFNDLTTKKYYFTHMELVQQTILYYLKNTDKIMSFLKFRYVVDKKPENHDEFRNRERNLPKISHVDYTRLHLIILWYIH